MSPQNLLYVFLGGGAGSVLRFSISWVVKTQTQVRLPVATLSANILSVIVLSLVYLFIQQKENGGDSLRYLLIIGFCGGLSTFSTFSFETFELFKKGETLWAWGNIVLNNAVCIAFIYLMLRKTAA
jgi:fluoride exporter